MSRPFQEREKSQLVKIELYVSRATYGNLEKLRQALKADDIANMIVRILQRKIRQTLGRHYVPLSKEAYVILQAKAQEKGVEIEDVVTEIILEKTKAA